MSRRGGRATWQFALTPSMRAFGKTRQTAGLPYPFWRRQNMATMKRASKKNPANQETGRETGPKASRPHMPGYGVPKDKKGLLPWSHVTERMAEAQNYWICTVSPGRRPHATPVWGVWLDDRLYFGGGPQTRRRPNLGGDPAVGVAFGRGLRGHIR